MTTIKSVIAGLFLVLFFHSALMAHGSKLSKLHHRRKLKLSNEKLNKRSFYYNSGKFRNLPLRKVAHADSHTRSLYPNYYPYPPSPAYYPQPASYPASYSNYPAASSSYSNYYPAPAAPAASQVVLPEVYLYTSAYPGQNSVSHGAAASEDTQPNRNEIFTIKDKQYKSIGCWNDDMNNRALKSQEGKHPLLKNPNYKARTNALMKCAQVASEKNFKLFALQNGGQCFGQKNSDSYKKHGPSQNCKGDGEGGPLSNEVYSFVENNKTLVPMEKNQSPSGGWSGWSPCAQPCNGAQGSQSRYRPCVSTVPSNPCSGPVYETRSCAITLCLPSVVVGSTAAPSTAATTGAPTTGASGSSVMPATGSTTPPPSTTASASSVMPATGSTTPPPTTPTATSAPAPAPSPQPFPTTPPAPVPAPFPPTAPEPLVVPAKVCKATVDLGFVVDGSGSIEAQGVGNFGKCKDFVKKLIEEFDVSPKGTHVGVIVYDHQSKVEFGFDKYTDKQAIFTHIDGIKYPNGGTKTGAALTLAKTGLFEASSRKGVPNILIVMTDGKSGDPVLQPAQKLRDSGVTVFSIGIGKQFVAKELNDMATDPDSEHVITTGFDQLDSVVKKIKDKACQGAGGATQSPAVATQPLPAPVPTTATPPPPTPAPLPTTATPPPPTPAPLPAPVPVPTPPPPPSAPPLPTTQAPCKAKVDLGFLLDSSGSIETPPNGAPGNFKKCLDFIVKMVQEFEISADGTHIGLIRYETTAQLIFDFKKYTDQSSVTKAIEAVPYTKGGTRTGQGITKAKTDLFDATARSGVKHILIIMTDGTSTDNVDDPSKALRDSGVVIYGVGIGSNTNMQQLKTMATDPDDKHVFQANFNDLGSVVKLIKDQACQGSTTTSGGSQTGSTTTSGGSQTGSTTTSGGSQTGSTTTSGGSQTGSTTTSGGSQTGSVTTGSSGAGVQPLAVYPFNNQFKTRDAIGKAPEGVASNVVLAQGYKGEVSGSYQFQGNANSYIEIPNNENGVLDIKGSITILAKVFIQQRGPLFNYKIDGWGVHFWIVNGPKLFVRVTKRDNLGFTTHLETSLQKNQWKSLGFSYDSSSGVVSLWVDGNQAASNNIGKFDIATNYAIRIGAKKGDTRYFKGRIACIQIYNMALNKDQVSAAMNYCDRYNTNVEPAGESNELKPNPEGESYCKQPDCAHVEPTEEVVQGQNGNVPAEFVEKF